jgi:hypothetical protein
MATSTGGMIGALQVLFIQARGTEVMAVHTTYVKSKSLLHGVGVKVSLVRETDGLASFAGLGRKGDQRATALRARADFFVAQGANFSGLASEFGFVALALRAALVVIGARSACSAFRP